jgi:hypothetical protein
MTLCLQLRIRDLARCYTGTIPTMAMTCLQRHNSGPTMHHDEVLLPASTPNQLDLRDITGETDDRIPGSLTA